MVTRCGWAGTDPLYVAYHDGEWGVPVHDDVKLFEFLVLEGAQAGLSWLTILRKREAYRSAFNGFDPFRVVSYDGDRVELLMKNAGIVRNRRKIASAVCNAGRFLDICERWGSFDSYIWNFVDGRPIVNAWENIAQVPSRTSLAETISKDMKKKGFSFVGPTIIYSFMQAVGMVNDHITGCFRYAELQSRIDSERL